MQYEKKKQTNPWSAPKSVPRSKKRQPYIQNWLIHMDLSVLIEKKVFKVCINIIILHSVRHVMYLTLLG